MKQICSLSIILIGFIIITNIIFSLNIKQNNIQVSRDMSSAINISDNSKVELDALST